MLLELQKRISDIKRGVTMTSLSQTAQSQLQAIMCISQKAREQVMQHHIRKSLAFAEMTERLDSIGKPHDKTFTWFFSNDDSLKSAPERIDARRRYVRWLSSGTGMFHIAGKPGSGKSTLMKFLSRAPSTTAGLLQWPGRLSCLVSALHTYLVTPGSRKIITVGFFFWKPAHSKLLKSISGLRKSILHDILNECPELVSAVFPTKWSELMAVEFSQIYDCKLSDEDVENGFNSLLRLVETDNKHRLRFFIDALDEFEGLDGQTFRDLVDELKVWTTIAPSALKLCVSSREYPVFQDHLNPSQRLRLQDLTQFDMLCYVRDRLGDIEECYGRERIIKNIAARAEGVFLWVALVTKNVRQGYEDGRALSSLEVELDVLPNELSDLFGYLLGSISSTQRRRAYQIFALIMVFEGYYSQLSLLACLFLDDFDKNPQFAVHSNRTNISPGLLQENRSLAHESNDEPTSRAKRLIQACCKGLIEVRDISNTSTLPAEPLTVLPATKCILFVHRSVLQFLRQTQVSHAMTDQLSSFGSVEAVSQLHLAELRRLNGSFTSTEYWKNMCANIIRMRANIHLDEKPYEFLESLEMTPLPRKLGFSGELEWRTPSGDPGWKTVYVFKSGQAFFSFKWGVFGRQGGGGFEMVCPLYLAARFGVPGYAEWKLLNEPKILQNHWISTALVHCLLSDTDNVALRPSDYRSIQVCLDLLVNQNVLGTTYAMSLLLAFAGAINGSKSNVDSPFLNVKRWYVSHFLQKITAVNKVMLRTAMNSDHPRSLIDSEHANAPREAMAMNGLSKSWFNMPLAVREGTDRMLSLRDSLLLEQGHEKTIDRIDTVEASIYEEMKKAIESQGKVTNDGPCIESHEAVPENTTKRIRALLGPSWTRLFTQPIFRMAQASTGNGVLDSQTSRDGSVEIPYQLFGHINLPDGFRRFIIAVAVCILVEFREVTATR
jgi:energy-coupling factor transporter ATP-binding protein EcfA2